MEPEAVRAPLASLRSQFSPDSIGEGAFDKFLDLCDSLLRRGKRSGGAGPFVALCDVDRP